MALDPGVIPVRGLTCPECGEVLAEAVATPHGQLHGPTVRDLREAFQLHVVVVVPGPMRRYMLVCCHQALVKPRAYGPPQGGVALGQREVAAYDARAELARQSAEAVAQKARKG